jgi:L-2-hydroxyglutarate oxidase LhgO
VGERVDVLVVGGGLVGLSTAYRLLSSAPDLSVEVVEKESRVATHQSGRNSGVLHSGLYYRPGSLRARLCTGGKRALEEYAERRSIPIRRLGKLVVAVDDGEIPRLLDLHDRGRANGVEGLEMLDRGALRELEPAVEGVRALRVPGTSVIDFREVADRLAEDVRALGGRVVLGERVRSAERRSGEHVVVTSAREVSARVVVGCAGLQGDRLASAMGLRPPYRIVPFRGSYRDLVGEGRTLVRGLVYPVPDPSLPFLGVHFTPQADGAVWVGPNAVLALSREGRRRFSASARDVVDALGYPGLWRLARRHARSGLDELRRDLSERAFLRECRRYVPALEAGHLGASFSGVRAQLMNGAGELIDDFVIGHAPRRVLVLNAPSPGATACLAIGGVVADHVRRELAARGSPG